VTRNAFVPASRVAVLFTIPAVLVIIAVGAGLGTLHLRRGPFPRELVALLAWGGAQQFVLQTVVLRELRQLASPAISVLLSAVLFGLVHVPNPLLMLVTFIGALAWCRIFIRYPNIVPLTISQAAGTLALLYAFNDSVTGRLRIGHAYLMLGR
jgi:membrane protease YdiL (CAAX protease family)